MSLALMPASAGDLAKLPLFDRTGWRRVRLADVAVRVAGKITPDGKTVHRWVAADHIDEANVHVRRWSDTTDPLFPPTFRFTFKSGDIMIHSRNPKKVAMPRFDGITGEKLFVLRPRRESELLTDFLLFVFLSEKFQKWVDSRMAGSCNKFLNWSALENFEFDLPPLDQQRRIADILWAADVAMVSATDSVFSAQALRDAELSQFLYENAKWAELPCEAILQEGPRNGVSPNASDCGNGLPTLSISSIREGRVVTNGNIKYANISEREAEQFRLIKGDILVVRGNGNKLLCGCAGLVSEVPLGCFYPDLLIRLRFKPELLLPEFAVMQWNEPLTHAKLIAKAKSSNGIWKINGKDIKSHALKAPLIEDQHRFLAKMHRLNAIVNALSEKAATTRAVASATLNTLFV